MEPSFASPFCQEGSNGIVTAYVELENQNSPPQESSLEEFNRGLEPGAWVYAEISPDGEIKALPVRKKEGICVLDVRK